MHITSAARAQPVQTELTRSRAQQKRYPTAAAASVPRATAGAAFVAAEAPDGPGAGASVAVATPTKDDATTAAVAAAARILSLRVAAISIASYESTGDAGNGELTRKLARAGGGGGCLIWDEKKSERCRVYIAAIGEAFRLFLRCMCALFRQGRSPWNKEWIAWLGVPFTGWGIVRFAMISSSWYSWGDWPALNDQQLLFLVCQGKTNMRRFKCQLDDGPAKFADQLICYC